MSETEGDRGYYAAAEAAFIARRGTPFLLSPKDFTLLKEWRALGIPLEAITAGIDDAFTKREERGATGRVNSLSYCRDAILSVWERRAETAVGRGAGRAGEKSLDPSVALARLSERLDSVARIHPELTERIESALRSLDRLARSPKPAGEIEASLARLDRRLSNDLSEALPVDRRLRIDSRVDELLAKARVKMDRETEEKTRRALMRRTLREELALPRLTLLAE
ncbi:MAG TPA: hypothetical protein VGA31_06585 [Thermoanaerobaculia bacterium]